VALFRRTTSPPADPHERDASVGAARLTAPAPRAEMTARVAAVRRAPVPDRRLGAGRALTRAERDRFEPGTGLDLGPVRVHDGRAAKFVAAERRATAFTYGNHVVLGEHAQGSRRTPVLAHELVHVRQQAVPLATSDPAHRPRGPPAQDALRVTSAPLSEQCLELPGWATSAVDVVADVGSSIAETAVDIGGAALDVALEAASVVVDRLAPGLLGFLRGGGLTQLTDLLCTGLGTLVDGYFAVLGDLDPMSTIQEAFGAAAEGARGVQAAISDVASSALGTVLGPMVQALGAWSGPIVETIRSVSDTVNGLFTGLWDAIGVPVLDFLGTVGGAVWETFTGLVTWIWNLTAPIRDLATSAWEWLLQQFDLAWDSTSGVRSWLADLASDAWSALLETVEPIREPLLAAGATLVLLSPLGPVVVLTQVVPPLWDALSWLWQNWNSADVLVTARQVLEEQVLPGVIGAVSGVAVALADAAGWLAGVVGGLGEAMSGVLSAFGASSCLRAVTGYLVGIADQFTRLAEWARSGFEGLTEALTAVLDAVVAFFRPILDFLARLALVVANPFLLPVALAASIWLLCPEELKPPVIAFVLDLLIAAIDAFPAFLTGLGPLASVLKAGVLGFLRHLRGGKGVDDDLRVRASDKVAGIAAGGGLEFIAGLALGVLHGLVDGIIDPFRLIFLIGHVLVVGAQAIARAVQPLAEATGLTAIGAATRATVGPGPAAQAPRPAAAEPAAVPSPTAAAPVAEAGPVAAAPVVAPAAEPARAPPAAEELPALEFEPGGPTDAEVVAAMSPEAVTEAAALGMQQPVDESVLEAQMRSETESTGSSVGGLAQLLGDAWNAILTAAEGLGARAAGALLDFILQPDFEMGRQIGFVIGMVLLEALIGYFTAGGYTVLKSTSPLWRRLLAYFLRFLDLGGELFGVLGKALKPLQGPLMAGLAAARGSLSRFRFAADLIGRLKGLATTLFRFGDETTAAATRATAEAAATGAERAAVRTAGEAVEIGAERAVQEAAEETAERTAREAAEAGAERTVVESADEVGEGAVRTAHDAAPPTVHDDALKAAELPQALIEARAIEKLHDDVLDSSVATLLASLVPLKTTYRWIDRFEAIPVRPGVYDIELVASPGTRVGRFTDERQTADKDVGEILLGARTIDGHTYKVTESGRIWRCTRCEDILALLDYYPEVFAGRQDYLDRLTAVEDLAKQARAARATRAPTAAALADRANEEAASLFRDVRSSAGVQREVASASLPQGQPRRRPRDIPPVPVAQVREAFDDLARERLARGLPAVGSPEDAHTLCRLDVGGERFYSVNAHHEPIDLVVNAQSATHAEGGAFQQAARSLPASRETRAVLYVDRELCRACGDFGAVTSMAKQLGILHLDVYTPSGLSKFSFSSAGR
jgi:hypothetical protein